MPTTGKKSVRDVKMQKTFLKGHPEICDEIEKKVRIHYHLLPDDSPEVQEEASAEEE